MTGHDSGPPADCRFLFVVGTRPEIIKLGPVFRAAADRPALDCTLVHTNQHYDEAMSDVFLDAMDLPAPDVELGVGSGGHAEQTAAGLRGIDECFEEYDPDVVLAQGDTNAVLSTALAASKRDVLFAHVEAGIRSGDESMPEEVNRVLADDVADLLFAPTETAAANLREEGLTTSVHVTGNTVVDAIRAHVDEAVLESEIRERVGVADRPYAVATIHRPRNTDDRSRLHRILDALDNAVAPVVLPAHPRVAEGIAAWPGGLDGALVVVDPLEYVAFLSLLREANAVVTDSGGVQEEASVFEVPCLTVRSNTERPETVLVGVNELVEPSTVGDRLDALLSDPALRASMRGHPDLYGDGQAAERIVSACVEAVAPEPRAKVWG